MNELKLCPDVIYLQACDECYDEASQHFEGVSWCTEPQDHANFDAGEGHETIYDEEKDEYKDYPQDTMYIRASRLKKAVEEIDKLVKESAYNAVGDNIDIYVAIEILYKHIPELKEAKDDHD